MKLIKLEEYTNPTGSLIPLDNLNLPFNIVRSFYIYDCIGVRGEHAHYETQQVIIALNGSCKVELHDGNNSNIFELNTRNVGLHQDAMEWGKMYDFSEDCILLVLANTKYDLTDYIFDFDKFLMESSSDSSSI